MDIFKYQGVRMQSTLTDNRVRKGSAWKLSGALRIFRHPGYPTTKTEIATIETILLYTWALVKAIKVSLDVCYTKMLRIVQDVSWRDNMTAPELDGWIPLIIKSRRLNLAKHWHSYHIYQRIRLSHASPRTASATNDGHEGYVKTLIDNTGV